MMQQPARLFPRPFAQDGDRVVLPDAPGVPGRASFQTGFPQETQQPLNAGGVAPSRVDFNAIFHMLSAFAFWTQSGGQWAWKNTLDYSKPALVYHDDKLWWCLADNGPGSAVVTPGTNPAVWQELLMALAGQMTGGAGTAVFGNPVGTIIMYYGTTAPEGYIVCDGRTFSASTYPLLYARLGKATTPDMRGVFVRGYDPTGARDPNGVGRALGSVQQDAGRNVTGKFIADDQVIGRNRPTPIGESFLPEGAFAAGENVPYDAKSSWYSSTGGMLTFDASRCWGAQHTANEFRPVNMNLLYCIKHD